MRDLVERAIGAQGEPREERDEEDAADIEARMGDFDFEAPRGSPAAGEVSVIVDGVMHAGKRSVRRRGGRVWVDDAEVTLPLRRVPVHPLLSDAPVYVRGPAFGVLEAYEPMPVDLVSRAARDSRRAAYRFMLVVAMPILVGVALIGWAAGLPAVPLVLLINLAGWAMRSCPGSPLTRQQRRRAATEIRHRISKASGRKE